MPDQRRELGKCKDKANVKRQVQYYKTHEIAVSLLGPLSQAAVFICVRNDYAFIPVAIVRSPRVVLDYGYLYPTYGRGMPCVVPFEKKRISVRLVSLHGSPSQMPSFGTRRL